MRRWGAQAKEIVWATLAIAGIRLDRPTPLRQLVACALAAFYALPLLFPAPTRTTTVLAFAAVFVARYGFLFASFGRGWIADRLRGSLGNRRGFAIYEAATSLQFCLRAITMTWLLDVTRGSLGHMGALAAVAAAALVAGATLINVWATVALGIDGYYYRDLFTGSLARAEFSTVGPYRWFANPMYGVGQLSSYGVALLAASWQGLAAAAANQIAMYAFYFAVERPHLAAMLATRSLTLPRSATAP